MTEWTETTLGALCKFQAGDAFPKDQQGVSMGEYPFIKVSDMNLPGNERFIQRANNWIRKADASKYRLHPPGAVVFAKIGEALRANRRRVLVRETIIDNNMMSAAPKGGINPAFLLYVLEGIDFNDISRGSALPYLAAGDLNKLSVTIPKPEAQSAIANTLSLLDRKIELNRRMNETLEGMAQAIFRDWFVDFGPTRRKAAGEGDPVAIMGGLTPDPARAAELAALFPAAFGDDGLPVGWKAGTLDRLALVNPESWKTKHHPAQVEYVDLSNTKWGTIEATAILTWDAAPSRARRIARTGDTIVGTVRPGNGSYAYIGRDGYTASTGFAVLRPKQAIYTDAIYVAATAADNITRLANLADGHGGAYPAVNPDVVAATSFPVAPDDLLAAFSAFASPLRAKVEQAKLENRTLAETRDYLLPRLMSGAVRVAPKVEAA